MAFLERAVYPFKGDFQPPMGLVQILQQIVGGAGRRVLASCCWLPARREEQVGIDQRLDNQRFALCHGIDPTNLRFQHARPAIAGDQHGVGPELLRVDADVPVPTSFRRASREPLLAARSRHHDWNQVAVRIDVKIGVLKDQHELLVAAKEDTVSYTHLTLPTIYSV